MGDDYEPIIADRRKRETLREDEQPLWRVVVAICAGLVVVVLIGWWLMDRSSTDGASTSAPSESSAPDIGPGIHVEQEPTPPARDLETNADVDGAQAPAIDTEPGPGEQPEPAPGEQPVTPENEPAATPESPTEGVPDNAAPTPTPTPAQPATVSVRVMSPDAQVQIELRGPIESSSPVTIKAGDVIDVAPGLYRVTASGAQLESFEQEVTFDGERPYEYTVELCAERKIERENLAGRVIEERVCASAAQCESMFSVLSEYADQLVQDRAFRTQQCAKWRPDAAPDGKWTLGTKCDGATLATTCRVEIGEGACVFAEPRRSSRGAECPRAELK